jgi:hypothetical protein
MHHLADAGMNDPLLSRYGPNTLLVERLLSRVRMLASADLGRAVVRWREVVGPEWHAAERALGHAFEASDRHAEQSRVLERLHDVILRRWFGGRPSADERRPTASAPYVVATALLALVVLDKLPAEQLSLLYAPVAEVIPFEELAGPAWGASLAGWGTALDDLPTARVPVPPAGGGGSRGGGHDDGSHLR